MIEADVVAEGKRVLARAADGQIPLRLLGGVAIYLRAPNRLAPPFARSYGDLDFVTGKKTARAAAELFRKEGYAPHVAFNALHGQERMLFFDEEHDRQVDVFVGAFSMSHKIPLDERIEVDPVSIPLAELLLTKLQIAELNEKDVLDTLALLHDHPVGDADGETLNAGRVAELCATDWGLWRTITGNLTACRDMAAGYEIPDRAAVEERAEEVLRRIEAEPKTRGWRLRAKVGERKRWYELPEEVAGGP
ncbi:MAG TPA: hypothetical protein VGJ34_12455 [Gaiellaceae bacterium]